MWVFRAFRVATVSPRFTVRFTVRVWGFQAGSGSFSILDVPWNRCRCVRLSGFHVNVSTWPVFCDCVGIRVWSCTVGVYGFRVVPRVGGPSFQVKVTLTPSFRNLKGFTVEFKV